MRIVSSLISLGLIFAAVVPAQAQRETKHPKPTAESGSSTAASAAPREGADLKNPALKNKGAIDKRHTPPAPTKEREAAALTFVQQHHPALVELLTYLKEKKPAAYDQAILDLFRVSERLAQQQEENLDRYEIELALWKVESRIELLAARLKMVGRDSPEGKTLVPELKQLLADRHQLREDRLLADRQKLAERIEKIDRQLEAAKTNREPSIERDLHRLVDETAAVKAVQKPKAPVDKRPPKT